VTPWHVQRWGTKIITTNGNRSYAACFQGKSAHSLLRQVGLNLCHLLSRQVSCPLHQWGDTTRVGGLKCESESGWCLILHIFPRTACSLMKKFPSHFICICSMTVRYNVKRITNATRWKWLQWFVCLPRYWSMGNYRVWKRNTMKVKSCLSVLIKKTYSPGRNIWVHPRFGTVPYFFPLSNNGHSSISISWPSSAACTWSEVAPGSQLSWGIAPVLGSC